MTKSDIFGLVFKILGLYFFVLVATNFMQFVGMLINFGDAGWGSSFWIVTNIPVMIFGIIVYSIIGYFLIFKTGVTLRLLRILPDDKVLELNINKTDVIEICLAIIGVIAIVFPISYVLGNISEIVYFTETDEFGGCSLWFVVAWVPV